MKFEDKHTAATRDSVPRQTNVASTYFLTQKNLRLPNLIPAKHLLDLLNRWPSRDFITSKDKLLKTN